jgi:hypothetical protein
MSSTAKGPTSRGSNTKTSKTTKTTHAKITRTNKAAKGKEQTQITTCTHEYWPLLFDYRFVETNTKVVFRVDGGARNEYECGFRVNGCACKEYDSARNE